MKSPAPLNNIDFITRPAPREESDEPVLTKSKWSMPKHRRRKAPLGKRIGRFVRAYLSWRAVRVAYIRSKLATSNHKIECMQQLARVLPEEIRREEEHAGALSHRLFWLSNPELNPLRMPETHGEATGRRISEGRVHPGVQAQVLRPTTFTRKRERNG